MKNSVVSKISALVSQSPWFWITVLFFGQAACSIVFSGIVHIPPESVALPILVLFLGGVWGLWFFLFDRSERVSRWKWVVPALFYATFITLMSHRSFSGVVLTFDTGYFHPLEYMTLGLFVGRFWYWMLASRGPVVYCLLVLATGGLFGALDEYHQSFVPGRDCDFMDFLLDLAGTGAALIVIFLVRRRISRRTLTKAPPDAG